MDEPTDFSLRGDIPLCGEHERSVRNDKEKNFCHFERSELGLKSGGKLPRSEKSATHMEAANS